MFSELLDETIPPQDMPMFVGHGRKVKSLCDKSAIATKDADKMERRVGKAAEVTLLLSYWRGI
jgi:hypothetical protein